MTAKFVNGDIVVFRSDNRRVTYQIEPSNVDDKVKMFFVRSPDGDDKGYADGGGPDPVFSYPHLLVLAEPLMQFFRFDHLQPEQQTKSYPFWALATKIVTEYPRNPERTVALRKLLEAKDAAVRSTLYQS